MDLRARTRVIIGWRQCIALHRLKIRVLRILRVLVGTLKTLGYKMEQRTRAMAEDCNGEVILGVWITSN